ncbi:hypothetical protein HIM_05475 [Hirsutella minnesotensis 3608]|uniref:Probable methionine--tRNA ligase, mitochondrial n=1 Tax=Hirsutella minnesotensis 3608 TaxID=1043627 RepID=A0A0F8A5A5_9HYPO|nr:hypothetical protein HIM_05475 [Hirsutella minnesotensis 3608]
MPRGALKPLASLGLRGLQRSGSRVSSRINWTCASCRAHAVVASRYYSSFGSSSEVEKPYYVTTPIFYVNASPHIGHLYSMVLADVLKRWQLINGKNAILCTGTDEHGMKIQQAALKEGIPPKDFCDFNSAKFRDLGKAANVDHDFFIRTTDDEHKEAVKSFWLQLKHGLPEGLGLYKGTHKGWYSVSDECFYPEAMIQTSIVPQTGKKIQVSIETGSEVELVEEETWFFPLTKYKDRLLEFYEANPDWITPAHRMNEVRDWVAHHLEDLSITRPASRLSWGIPAPETDDQTIYVWVDALINYITVAGYGSKWHLSQENMSPWPADVQVIGKDILRFHGVYWPALLMALNLPLPKKILCHNHWTLADRKMSKSLGNVVNPFFAMQRWDVDPLRYFLMAQGSLSKDMSYSNRLINAKYVKDLQANIGNLFYRIARPKVTGSWSTAEAVAEFRIHFFDPVVSTKDNEDAPKEFFTLERPLQNTTPAFVTAMNNLDTSSALRNVYELQREANRFVSETRPWDLVKNTAYEARLALLWVIFSCAEALRISGILLQPIMPTKAKLLLDELGVRADRRTVDFAHPGKDADYGTEAQPGPADARIKKWETIFPPTPNGDLTDEELRKQLRALLQSTTKNKMNQMAELLAIEARLGEEAVAQLLAQGDAGLEKLREAQSPP